MTALVDGPIELEVALELATSAAELLVGYAERGVPRRRKSRRELVSEADIAAQELIVAGLRRAFPDDGIVAEEDGGSRGSPDTGRRWFIDPLDGTTNFLKGQPRWGTSIGFYGLDGSAVGVVTCPPRGETFHAHSGGGAFLNGDAIGSSDVGEPGDAVVASGFPYDFTERSNLDEWAAVTPNVLTVRSLGAAALDLCDVATGRLDAFWEQRLGLWDTAAGIVIAAEAGALVTDLDGNLLTAPSGDVVAANPELHPRLMMLLHPAGSDQGGTGAPVQFTEAMRVSRANDRGMGPG